MVKKLAVSLIVAVALLVYATVLTIHTVRVLYQCQQYGYSQWRVDPDFDSYCAVTLNGETRYKSLRILDPATREITF